MIARSAIALVLLAGSAFAQSSYKRTAVPDREQGDELCVTWNRRDITYQVDSNGSQRTPGEAEFTAIDAAFASWQALSDTCSDFQFIRGQRAMGVPVGRGTQDSNVITFRETSCRDVVPQDNACLSDGTCANLFNCWDHLDLTIALTTVTYSKKTGLIYDADIELNASPHADGPGFLFTTIASPPCQNGMESASCVATDIQNTMTHEIGHFVGFDHVEIAGSLMEPTAPPGETSKRIIDRGTAEGFCSTYPKGQPPLPCNVIAQSQRRITASNLGTVGLAGCGCDGAGALAPTFLVLLVLSSLCNRRLTRVGVRGEESPRDVALARSARPVARRRR